MYVNYTMLAGLHEGMLPQNNFANLEGSRSYLTAETRVDIQMFAPSDLAMLSKCVEILYVYTIAIICDVHAVAH